MPSFRPLTPSVVAALVAAVVTASGMAGAIPSHAAILSAERLPVTENSTPFSAATVGLDAHGFVEEEFQVSGLANVYDYNTAGEVEVHSADVPYASRILVRRPIHPQRFNGVVLFEMFNPTAGFDIGFEWYYNRQLLLERGFAWVGLTIKDTAIDFLRSWDAERYGDLSMVDRGLAYDIYAQVAALLRDSENPDNPLAGYPVISLLGTGYSQSADYLTTFSNEFHDSALTFDGSPAFDGYLLGGGNGSARRINSAAPEFYTDDRRFNRVDAPLIRVQSETELAVFRFPSSEVRQPDSDRFRMYEVPGTSHGDLEILTRTGEAIARDLGIPVLPTCGDPLSPFRISPVHRAALVHLVRWVSGGEPPPPSRQIELAGLREVVRDSDGNALGGVRLPPINVPIARYEPGNSGAGPCTVSGTYTPFGDAYLAELYPRHGRYVKRVVRSALRAMRQGYLLPKDATAYIIDAARSEVGR